MALVTAGPHGSHQIEPVSLVGSLSPGSAAVAWAERRAACSRWALVGAAWTGVDRWGQAVGTRRLASREFYAVTECFEAAFPDDPRTAVHPRQPGRIVLYENGAWSPQASVEWLPDNTERRTHEQFVATLTPLVLPPVPTPTVTTPPNDPPEPALPAIADRTMFFHVTGRAVDAESNAGPSDRQFAVSGGRVLIIAERNRHDGHWSAAYLQNAFGAAPSWNNLAYIPIAVFDMNSDGWPEIVCHEREGGGEFFGDIVISRDSHGVWTVVARSVGGSTA
jgi:hypothetical protein